MINQDKNIRIYITISKKQYNWLEDFASKKNITKSKLISWLLAKKTKDVIDTLKLDKQPLEAVEETSDNIDKEISDEEIRKCFESLEETKRKAFEERRHQL